MKSRERVDWNLVLLYAGAVLTTMGLLLPSGALIALGVLFGFMGTIKNEKK